MAIIGHFDYSRKWTSPDDFPTYEASEEQVRADMQALFDEISAYLNGTLIDWVEQQISGAITGQIPDRSLTNLKLALGTITGAEIDDATIGNNNMAANSIDSDQYVDGSIDEEHFSNGAVSYRALAEDAVRRMRESRAGAILTIWQGTQAQYDALGTKDATTLYFLTES